MAHIPQEAISIAKAILSGHSDIVEGSLELSYLGGWWTAHEENEDWTGIHDNAFDVFRGVESDTLHLPRPEMRRHWNEAALQKKDAEWAEYKSLHQDEILQACRSIIEEFS